MTCVLLMVLARKPEEDGEFEGFEAELSADGGGGEGVLGLGGEVVGESFFAFWLWGWRGGGEREERDRGGDGASWKGRET